MSFKLLFCCFVEAIIGSRAHAFSVREILQNLMALSLQLALYRRNTQKLKNDWILIFSQNDISFVSHD